MRICLYTDTALPKLGGQEMVVDALARQYRALGHEVSVFAPMPRKLSTHHECYPYPVARHPRFVSTRYIISWYRWFLWQQYRKNPFDLLHCHGIYAPAYLASLLKGKLNVPVVVTSHGGDVFESNVRLQKAIVHQRCVQGLDSADALVAISQFTQAGYERICPDAASRIVRIPNGVHVSAFAPRVEPPIDWDFNLKPGYYALFLGRLKYRKGVDVLLQAMTRVPPSGRVQLVIAGDGEERPYLEKLSEQLGLASRVRFVGAVAGQTKSYLLQNARFGVVPSRQWEAFGLVVLEGYAAGLPMIVSNMPGLADLVQPNRTGVLVAPEAPEALALAMCRLFGDDELVSYMSTRAMQVAQAYDWSEVARRHLDLYEQLVAARHSTNVEAYRVRAVRPETAMQPAHQTQD